MRYELPIRKPAYEELLRVAGRDDASDAGASSFVDATPEEIGNDAVVLAFDLVHGKAVSGWLHRLLSTGSLVEQKEIREGLALLRSRLGGGRLGRFLKTYDEIDWHAVRQVVRQMKREQQGEA